MNKVYCVFEDYWEMNGGEQISWQTLKAICTTKEKAIDFKTHLDKLNEGENNSKYFGLSFSISSIEVDELYV